MLAGAALAAAGLVVAGAEHRARRRLQRAHTALHGAWLRDRGFARDLRTELREQAERAERLGATGDEDVRALVLRAAIALVGAERGLLLSRRDADGDGDLDLVCAQGFVHDPEHSAVAQHFARVVLARDEIIRRDRPVVEGRDPTPADDEITTLVATPLFLRDRFSGVVLCADRPGGFEDVQDEVLLALGDHAGAALQQHRLRDEVREAHRGTVRVLVEALAARNPDRHRESAELAVRAVTLARDLGLAERERDVLVCATLLRATGELGLPDALFTETGPYTPEQRDLVELHPRLGFNVVGRLPALRDVARAILHHHERWDGEGYPAGLAGEAIPRPARALAVLEAYGAMVHDRPYRAALDPGEACARLAEGAGRQFDPEVVQHLVEDVRGGGGSRGELAEVVLEALPLDPALVPGGGGVLAPLGGATTDGLTLLGNQRALQQDLRDAARAAAEDGAGFGVVLVRLEDLADVNDRDGLAAGDRLLQLAGRDLQRMAARAGGTAYRAGGRRLAVLAPLVDGRPPEGAGRRRGDRARRARRDRRLLRGVAARGPRRGRPRPRPGRPAARPGRRPGLTHGALGGLGHGPGRAAWPARRSRTSAQDATAPMRARPAPASSALLQAVDVGHRRAAPQDVAASG